MQLPLKTLETPMFWYFRRKTAVPADLFGYRLEE